MAAVRASGRTVAVAVEVEPPGETDPDVVLIEAGALDDPDTTDVGERSGHSAYAALPPITRVATAPTAIQGHGDDLFCTTGV